MPTRHTDHTWEIYKCGTYCQYINSNTSCTELIGNENYFSECNTALSHCDCRPAWKQPVVWIVAASFGFAFILMIRDFVIRLINRHSRIGRRTVVAQPIVSTVEGTSVGYNATQQYIAAAPIEQNQLPQWNYPPAPPPPYFQGHV